MAGYLVASQHFKCRLDILRMFPWWELLMGPPLEIQREQQTVVLCYYFLCVSHLLTHLRLKGSMSSIVQVN